MADKLKLGISACLLGQPVRYDGGHKLDRFLRDVLGPHVEYVPVCPEVECGLGVPREAMRLVGDPADPRLVTRQTKIDHTERMKLWAEKRVRELEKERLCGFVFKSGSPSSGMERVRVYGEGGASVKRGVGLFARAFMEHFPLLPVEDEGRLNDLALRENFIERIFVQRRWQEVEATRAIGPLVEFHTRHKLLILSHSPKHYRELGPLVAAAKTIPPDELRRRYAAILADALRLKATPAKHYNVLLHLMGYFKDDLSADEKRELLEVFDTYRAGHIPLIVPITLVNHYVRKCGQQYLQAQWYLNPHPVELRLRNHA